MNHRKGKSISISRDEFETLENFSVCMREFAVFFGSERADTRKILPQYKIYINFLLLICKEGITIDKNIKIKVNRLPGMHVG